MRNNAAVNAAVVIQKLMNKGAERDVLKNPHPFSEPHIEIRGSYAFNF